MTRCRLVLLGLLGASACLTLDPFFFGNEPVDEYRWDDDNPCDPQLEGDFVYVAREQGKSAGCHPSLVPPAPLPPGWAHSELGDSENRRCRGG